MTVLVVILTLFFVLGSISPLLITEDMQDIVRLEESWRSCESVNCKLPPGWVILNSSKFYGHSFRSPWLYHRQDIGG